MANTCRYLLVESPSVNVLPVVGIMLLLTVAPKLIVSPPSPSVNELPLSMMSPLTANVLATVMSCALITLAV